MYQYHCSLFNKFSVVPTLPARIVRCSQTPRIKVLAMLLLCCITQMSAFKGIFGVGIVETLGIILFVVHLFFLIDSLLFAPDPLSSLHPLPQAVSPGNLHSNLLHSAVHTINSSQRLLCPHTPLLHSPHSSTCSTHSPPPAPSISLHSTTSLILSPLIVRLTPTESSSFTSTPSHPHRASTITRQLVPRNGRNPAASSGRSGSSGSLGLFDLDDFVVRSRLFCGCFGIRNPTGIVGRGRRSFGTRRLARSGRG